jgi:hypothetical protein
MLCVWFCQFMFICSPHLAVSAVLDLKLNVNYPSQAYLLFCQNCVGKQWFLINIIPPFETE